MSDVSVLSTHSISVYCSFLYGFFFRNKCNFKKEFINIKKTFLQLTLIHAYKEIFFVRKTIEFNRFLANPVGWFSTEICQFYGFALKDQSTFGEMMPCDRA